MRRKAFPLILAALIGLFPLSACGTAGATKKPTPVPTQSVQNIKMGQTVRLGDLKFTVNGVREDSDNTLIPTKGNRWIHIDITVENVGKETDDVNDMYWFALRDSSGALCPFPPAAKQRADLEGDLLPGATMNGEVSYQITATQTNLTLEITPGKSILKAAPHVAYCPITAP